MEVTLGPIEAVPRGEGRAYQVGDLRLAVFRTRRGELFASQAECPHRGGPLADGLLGGCTVICPLHAVKFDLSTGTSSRSDCTIKTYKARLSDGMNIVVDLDENAVSSCKTTQGQEIS